MPPAPDVLALDATAQLQWLATGRIGALELLDLAMARRSEPTDRLNAVIRSDPDHARQRAKVVDERRLLARRHGEDPDSLGLLAGLPMTVKDVWDVDGMPASSGLPELLQRVTSDADVVGRVKAAGANVWGKTNTPVMAGDWQTSNALYGTTNNPWDLDRTPGGSSGGAAAALAGSITPLEIGGDIGGSLRVPASFCGVFAHKPTYGLISLKGSVPPRPGVLATMDLGVAGPMARSVRDLRLLLSVLTSAPIPARAPAADLGALRVGVWLEDPAFDLDSEVRLAVEAFAAELARAGARVEPIASPVDGAALLESYAVLLMSQLELPAATRAGYERLRGAAKLARGMGAGPLSWAGLVRASTASHRDWLAADEARAQMKQAVAATFSRFDLILSPCAPVAAFPHDPRPFQRRRLPCSSGRRLPYMSMLHWPALATVLGLPATAIPAGFTPGGLPVGVQLIGPAGSDSRTLAAAQAIEDALGGFVPPPLDHGAGEGGGRS